MKLKIISAIY